MNGDIKFYLTLLQRRLPVMAVIVMVCTGIGVALAITLPPKFEARASLLVEGAQINEVLADSTVQSEAAIAIQQIELRLMSRNNLIDIAQKNRVFEGTTMAPDEVVSLMRNQTQFSSSVQRRGRATTVSIAFEADNAQVAADVVNEYVTFVLREDAKRRTTESGDTYEFFVQRVDRLSQRLTEQSAEIVTFKEANNDALPDGDTFRRDRFTRLQERLDMAKRERISLVEQKNRLIEAGGISSTVLTPQQIEINRLETEIRKKLAFHAPDSATIKFLERRVEALRESGPIGATEDAPLTGVDQLLAIQVGEIESNINSLEDEMERIEEELVVLRAAIDKTPQVSIRLEALEREYANTQIQYNEAVRRRATAEQGVDVEAAAKGERISLVEGASVPNYPSAPNRKLVAGAGVFLGTALAAAFFLATELLNRSVRRPVDLSRALGVQPLATIPFLEEESTRRRRRIIKVVFLLAMMIAIPVVLWAIHTFYAPLDVLVGSITSRIGL